MEIIIVSLVQGIVPLVRGQTLALNVKILLHLISQKTVSAHVLKALMRIQRANAFLCLNIVPGLPTEPKESVPIVSILSLWTIKQTSVNVNQHNSWLRTSCQSVTIAQLLALLAIILNSVRLANQVIILISKKVLALVMVLILFTKVMGVSSMNHAQLALIIMLLIFVSNAMKIVQSVLTSMVDVPSASQASCCLLDTALVTTSH